MRLRLTLPESESWGPTSVRLSLKISLNSFNISANNVLMARRMIT